MKLRTPKRILTAFIIPIAGSFAQADPQATYNFDRKFTTSIEIVLMVEDNIVVPAGTEATFIKDHGDRITVVLEGWKVKVNKGAFEEFKASHPLKNKNVRIAVLTSLEERNRVNKDGPEGIWNSYAVGNEDIPSSDEEFENRVIELTNAERTSRGLKPLVWDRDLARAARYHAADQYVQNYASHDSKTPREDGSNP